ncbi:uncharacterized protein TNCV_3429601 [Trichonephila clavipes]|nr:uncharacterized protein TNCV_3429601 [Trichonephila clavipes]
MRLPLSEPREIYKDSLETDNGSNIGSECSFEIDLPGKRDRSTIYRLNLIKLYRRKPELANLVMENSSEGIDSETLFGKAIHGFWFSGCKWDGAVKPYSARCWVRKSEQIPVPARIKCMKYRNLNQVTQAEIYLLLKRERLVGKINAASWVIVLDLWKWYFRRSLMMNYPKHTTCVMTVGMYIIKKSRFKFLCAYDECNLTTLILRLLEQIELPRMVDIDILMEIWKNRVKKIDFVLKWLSRVGSEVGPTKGFCEWNTRNRWRDGQVCPDVDKELWRLGPDSSDVFWRVMRQ